MTAPLTIDEFERDYHVAGHGYVCAVVSYTATLIAKRWVLGRGLVHLFANPLPDFQPRKIALQGFMAGVRLINQDDVEALVKRLSREYVLEVDGHSFYLQSADNQTINLDYVSLRSTQIDEWPRRFRLDLSANHGMDIFAELEGRARFDFRLRTLDTPYDGFSDLINSLSLQQLDKSDNQSRAAIVGDFPLAIDRDKTRLDSGKLYLEVRAGAFLDSGKIRVGLRGIPDSPSARSSYEGKVFSWTDEPQFRKGTFQVDAPETSAIQIFLTYRNQPFDRWWIADSARHINVRVATYDPFDPGRVFLRQCLAASSDRSADDHEIAVGILLSLCGFSISQAGQLSRLGEGAPDLIALTPKFEVLVVEATTTGILDTKDKLSKVINRARALKEGLGRQGWGHLPVQGLIVSSAPRSQLTDLDKARQNAIAVAALEDVHGLLDRLVVPQDASDVYKQVVALIPKN